MIECGVVLFFLQTKLTMALLLGIILMHVLIFLTAGVLFWQSIIASAGFVIIIKGLSASQLQSLFTLENMMTYNLIAFAILLLYPTKIAILRPNKLAWWDTPFSGRVQWIIKSAAGKLYGLYNDFMKPHDRAFGRIYGFSLIKRPVLYYHLGEVFSLSLRNDIVKTKGKKDGLAILSPIGRVYYDIEHEKDHDQLMERYVAFCRAHKPKRILPQMLKFLDPPGGLYYYWGGLPPFDFTDKIKEIRIQLIEQFFDGEDFKAISNETIKTLTFDLDHFDG